MYIKKFQNAYLKITGQFNVPVALYDLEKELKRADENCSIVNLIDKLLNEFDNAAKKAKLLQIGFNMGKDRYMNLL